MITKEEVLDYLEEYYRAQQEYKELQAEADKHDTIAQDAWSRMKAAEDFFEKMNGAYQAVTGERIIRTR